MNLFKRFKKHKYIKVIKYKKDKSISVYFYKQENFKPDFLINDNHIFYNNGYRTILTSDTVKESINPLDLSSQYPIDKFQTAIESKVIRDVFNNLETSKIDIVKILLFANVGITAILLYFQVMK